MSFVRLCHTGVYRLHAIHHGYFYISPLHFSLFWYCTCTVNGQTASIQCSSSIHPFQRYNLPMLLLYICPSSAWWFSMYFSTAHLPRISFHVLIGFPSHARQVYLPYYCVPMFFYSGRDSPYWTPHSVISDFVHWPLTSRIPMHQPHKLSPLHAVRLPSLISLMLSHRSSSFRLQSVTSPKSFNFSPPALQPCNIDTDHLPPSFQYNFISEQHIWFPSMKPHCMKY